MQPSPLDHAFSLIAAGQLNEALPLLQDLADRDPSNGRIKYGLGLVFLSANQAERALPYLAEAAKAAKKDAGVLATLASALNINRQSEEALPPARKAASLAPRSEYAQRILGEVYADLRRPVMARQSFEQALKLEPRSARAHLGLYELETTLGNSDAAETHLEAAFAETPDDPVTLISAANSRNTDLQEKVLTRIESLLEGLPAGAASPEITKLAMAAGRILDARGETGNAFRYFDTHREGLYGTYDAERQAWFVEACKSVFTPDFFEARRDFALSSDKPVFVVGMPRSGTTLVEQIIARHPDAAGAGELQFIPDSIREMVDGKLYVPAFFDQVLKLEKRDAQRIGRRYLGLLDGLDRKARRVVDKMPHNFENLWLLALLFPNASFIHVIRNAADTCVSAYMTPLPAYHSYNADQAALGHYYGRYKALMDHWSAVLPVSLRHQSYEDLVGNQELESRALIDHVGLDWSEACLTPQEQDNQIFTFSREQVRKPVYSTSLDRWKRYEAHIQPLLTALGDKTT
jgi:Flp pilus assembly protein TadD